MLLRPPDKNSHYWGPKIARNIERDRENDAKLNGSGWGVVRVWEHDDIAEAVARIEARLK